MVPELLPLELPEPMLLPELEPVLPLEGAGLVLGDVVLLPEAPLPALESDLKWASHSEREIDPSLLVSTAEKVGAAALEDEVPPDAAGDDEDGLLVDGLLLLDDELCARAAPDSANSAAAVAAANSFRFNIG